MPKINDYGFVTTSKGRIFCTVTGYATIKDQIYLICELQGIDSGFMECGLFISEFVCHPDNFSPVRDMQELGVIVK